MRRLPAIFGSSLIGALICLAATGTFEAPSDLLAKHTSQFDLRFVLHPMKDLRRLYCDLETLADRQKRGVCRIDSTLIHQWRREVSVSTNTTLAEVLLALNLSDWNGGKQIRIVSKDTILQSAFPRPSGSSSDTWRKFSENRIQPADIVVICESD